MRNLHKIAFLLLGITLAGSFTACEDDDEHEASPIVTGNGAFFPSTRATHYALEGTAGSFTVPVYRTNKGTAADIEISVTEESGLFTYPATASFSADTTVAYMTFSFTAIEADVNYEFTLTIKNDADRTAYGDTAYTFTAAYSIAIEWEDYSTDGIFKERLMAYLYNIPTTIENIVIQKQKDKDIFRMRNVYGDGYEYYAPEDGDIYTPTDIIIDCETYSQPGDAIKTVYIQQQSIGLDFGLGAEFAITSIYNNLSSNIETYPLGTYDPEKGIIDFGACAVYYPTKDEWYACDENSILYLTADAMVIDYDNDFHWETTAIGTFTSTTGADPARWNQRIQATTDDVTLFRLPNLYAEGYSFVFACDTATYAVTAIDNQKTGLTVFGKEVYANASSNKTLTYYDQSTLTFHFMIYLSVTDEEGNHSIIGSYAETFQINEEILGDGSEATDLQPVNTIDDFCGDFRANFYDAANGADGELGITISKVDDNTLSVEGLMPNAPYYYDYDGSPILLNYADGYATFSEQVPGTCYYGEVYALAYSLDEDTYIDGAKLRMGKAANGRLYMLNDPSNKTPVDGILAGFIVDEQLYMADDYIPCNLWLEPADGNLSHAPALRAANHFKKAVSELKAFHAKRNLAVVPNDIRPARRLR